MKKFIASAAFLLAFAGYAAFQYLSNGSAVTYAAAIPPSSGIASSQTQPQQGQSTASAQSSPPPASTPASSTHSSQGSAPAPSPAKPKGQYVDGTYTGPAADAYYGYVQVQATISGGRLTNVTFLQYPNDRSYSRYVNSQATPLLAQEAIQAQSANVDGVSGASETSGAFVQSLGTALAQAKS